VAAEWLAPLLRIQEILGLNSDQTPAILTEAFRGFPQPIQVNIGTDIKLDYDSSLQHPFQLNIQYSSCNLTP
jgi:hypothetical protein